ncbi:MAG: hypothetical protein KKF48_01460 [Nanoarchaeota archaeon]|nr:hypothetical protein [Nanoarchaeota archaeon]MBU1027689.1 hypothetical protein [Nanoarchaeota archaeon]
MKKKGKIVLVSFVTIIFLILLISITSAGFFDNIKKTITGKAVSQVGINITVGAPEIRIVYNNSAVIKSLAATFNSAPLATTVIINFSVYLASGIENLNHSTAGINFTKGSEETRFNSTCVNRDWSGNGANFTCNVTMWWWDASGSWGIIAYVRDNNSNFATNSSTNFSIASTTGFQMGPVNLTWTVSPNSINQTPNDDPITLNNTGNKEIGTSAASSISNISLNATDLRGETTTTEVIWAANFSVALSSGGTFPNLDECADSFMVNDTFINISDSVLPNGNYTINDGTGQEQLHFCVINIGSISSQSYSTKSGGTWTLQTT